MSRIRIIFVSIFLSLILASGIFGQPSGVEAPLALQISPVPGQPGIVNIALTNQSHRPVKIVRPNADGQLLNLMLIFISDAGDTLNAPINPLGETQLNRPPGQLLTNLRRGRTIQQTLNIAPYVPGGSSGELQIVLESIFLHSDTSGSPQTTPRGRVFSKDVWSNTLQIDL